MYFIRTASLRQAISDGHLQSRASLYYLAGFLVVVPMSYSPALWSGRLLWIVPIRLASNAIVTVLGITYCYHRNRVPANFCERFLAIAFVTGIRFLLLSILIAISFVFAMGMLVWLALLPQLTDAVQHISQHSIASSFIEILIAAVTHALYFWRVGVHLGRISSPRDAAAATLGT